MAESAGGPDRSLTAAPYVPRTTYLAVAAGLSGAAAAWLLSQLLIDLGRVIDSYRILDIVVLALLGAGVGGFLLGFGARRQGQRVIVEAAIGAAIGALAAAAGGAIGLAVARIPGLGSSREGFLVARVVLWGLVGGLLGWGLGTRHATLDKGRPVDGAMFGFLGGAVAALIFSLPGPTSIWQLVAFLLVGSAVGFGTSRLQRAAAVLWRPGAARAANLIHHREWELYPDRLATIGPDFAIEVAGGRLLLRPSRAGVLTIAGLPVDGERVVGDDEVIVAGGQSYHVHRLPGPR